MKKPIIILFIALSLLTLSGCGSKAAPVPAGSASPAETVQPSEAVPPDQPASSATPSATTAPAQAEAPKSEKSDPDIVDVDLTQLSSTMVYSEVYAMVYEPEQYTGKTVKMHGLFATQEYNGDRLYACIVQDATACCAQGLEFEMAENLVYPDDYPEPGTEITVVGTFDSYKEEVDGNYYIYLVLRNARFI
jgi:Predicted membrane protein